MVSPFKAGGIFHFLPSLMNIISLSKAKVGIFACILLKKTGLLKLMFPQSDANSLCIQPSEATLYPSEWIKGQGELVLAQSPRSQLCCV